MKLKIALAFAVISAPAFAQQAPSPAVQQQVTQHIQNQIGALEVANVQLQAELQEANAKIMELQKKLVPVEKPDAKQNP